MTVLSIMVAAAASLCAVWVSTRDLALRRRMESIDRFLLVAATAQARTDRKSPTGTSEQVAAIELLADLGIRHRELRRAATAGLEETIRWSEPRGELVTDDEITRTVAQHFPGLSEEQRRAIDPERVQRVITSSRETLTVVHDRACAALERITTHRRRPRSSR